MTGRRSVFRDPLVRGLLKKHFTLAADETWRLQNGTGPECRFFQSFAVLGHYKGKGGTKQGYYVIAPSGKLLASANTGNVEKIVAMLDLAKKKWKALEPADRRLPPGSKFTPKHRWEQSYPKGGLILERFVRDIKGGDRRWNRDFVWFTKDEANSLLPGKTDKTKKMPRSLALRLARFHLIDNVRGQTLPFAASEIVHAEITLEKKRTDGDLLRLTVSGTTRAVAKGPWLLGKTDWTPDRDWPRTMNATLRGTVSYDLKRQRFVAFKVIAVGKRTGRTGNDGRGKDPKPGKVGFYFRLASPGVRIPPTLLEFYEADWVIRPSGAGYGDHK